VKEALGGSKYGSACITSCAGALSPTMHTSLRSILVELGTRSDPRALAAIAALARRENARLTLLAAVKRPPSLAWASPIALPVDLRREAREECEGRLRAAVERLPADLSITTLFRDRPVAEALLAELRTNAYDLAAVQTSRVVRALIGRTPVPVLILNHRLIKLAAEGVAA